ncbi:hypothetical protein NIASO_15675 [Niabella soli DSM 19437]|uniref:Uncharacterized protein n=1 Tax=Niabella soli DSM 19437 TaxID=929713 RepID=W0F4C8_9BACT|nr:hypothetical protein NIASO_15675 [Niabella soli DSM 19437]
MKKNPSRKQKRRKLQPKLKWQTSAYNCPVNFNFIPLYQFLLLCTLAEVTREHIVINLMANLALFYDSLSILRKLSL